jgi:hypothetical protein
MKITKLNKELGVLKEDYAKMIVKSYKSRSEQSVELCLFYQKIFASLQTRTILKAVY